MTKKTGSNGETLTRGSYRLWTEHTYEWFVTELRRCAARVIAFCDNSDLFFVGRSPDCIFDYLSGLLFDSSWANRLNLLHFSTGALDWQEAFEYYPSGVADADMRQYLTHLGLDPTGLARRERSVAIVDIVATGETFGKLVSFFKDWCVAEGSDWPAVRRKIRIVGLKQRTKTSPNTHRWQQHAEWISLLEARAVKNVSIPMVLFHFLGGGQPKMSKSYHPVWWGDPRVLVPDYDEKTLMALRLALSLFDDGMQKSDRAKFAKELSNQPAMQYSWFRDLLPEVKR